MERIDTFWFNFSVASNMQIPSAVLQFLTVDRQKDMTNLKGALLQRFVMKETEKRQHNCFLDPDL
jgi:hypothetical protein